MKPSLQNGVNLAYWLYKVHPEIYARILPQAIAAQKQKGMGRLGDDVSVTDIGTSTTFDPSSAFDLSNAGISPDLASLPAPDLVNVSVDAATNATTPSFQASQASTDTSSLFGAIGNGLSSVGSWLTSATGLSTVGNLATAVVKANTPQQQTIQTQVARVASGGNPAAITYGVNSAGQIVPIYAPAGTAAAGLTSQTLASLLPSSFQPYALPIGLGVIGWLIYSATRRGKR